jgi:23S rRNA (uridine2552-2'-O)-methyltransferase
VRVRTAKRRKASSTRWLKRQLNDPYVAEAQRLGYRSRAAFKLAELDDKLKFLKPGMRVVDLGAAPGGWTQLAVERVAPAGHVVAADITEMEPVPGAEILALDVSDPVAIARLREALGGAADVVLSDMAAPATGHRGTDHLRTMALGEAAADVGAGLLAEGGVLVIKVFQGGTEGELLAGLKQSFARVRHVKPPASRDESPETYLVALGFRGREV